MLYLLSAPQQSGKTRWLQSLVEGLEARGVVCSGVLAPGRWRREPDGSLSKLGIDNLLLPQHELLAFARPANPVAHGLQANRVDAAHTPRGDRDGCSQSRRAGLGWDISDAALGRVNRHFGSLGGLALEADRPGLMVVDELGPLELRRGEGLCQALALLEEGPRPAWPHAVVVVRPSLLDLATKRLRPAWGRPEPIEPTSTCQERVLEGFPLG